MLPEIDQIAAGIYIKDKKYFIAQRKENEEDQLKWEFPGGKLKGEEMYDEALIREFKEEFGNDIKVIQEVGGVEYEKDNKYILIMFFLIEGDFSNIKLNNHKETKFADINELKSLDLCAADKDFITKFETEVINLTK